MAIFTDQTALFQALAELSTQERQTSDGWTDALELPIAHLSSVSGVHQATADSHQKTSGGVAKTGKPTRKTAIDGKKSIKSSLKSEEISGKRKPPPRVVDKSSPNYRIYSTSAREILGDILELQALVLDRRRDYVLASGSQLYSLYGGQQSGFLSDADRVRFDQEVDLAVKQCTRLIKEFDEQLSKDKTLRTEDELKHLRFVGRLLTQHLKEVCKSVATLRQIYARKQKLIRNVCRLANLVEMWETSSAAQEEAAKRAEYMARVAARMEEKRREEGMMNGDHQPCQVKKEESGDGWEFDDADTGFVEVGEFPANDENAPKIKNGVKVEQLLDGKSETSKSPSPHFSRQQTTLEEFREKAKTQKERRLKALTKNEPHFDAGDKENEPSSAFDPEFKPETLSRFEQEQLQEENQALFARVAQADQELDRIESNLVEIQRLQHVFAEKITEQEHDIDLIHTHTITTLDNLDTANRFIRQAIENQANRRVVVLFCLIVLTFTLLFLDWYNP